jgi:hypothetical protein
LVPEKIRQDVKYVTEAILRDASKGPLGRSHQMVVDVQKRTTSTKFSEGA